MRVSFAWGLHRGLPVFDLIEAWASMSAARFRDNVPGFRVAVHAAHDGS